MKQFVRAWVILFCLVFAYQNANAQVNGPIAQAEAVNLAERFVARHGYDKKLRANEPAIYWVSEESEDSAKPKRSDSIQSRAVIALVKDEDGSLLCSAADYEWHMGGSSRLFDCLKNDVNYRLQRARNI